MAYSVDFTGDEIYDIYIQDLSTGKMVDSLKGVESDGSIEWGDDDNTIYYIKMDDLHRPYQVYCHSLNSEEEEEEDELLFEEEDELFWVSLEKSQDSNYLFIHSSSAETSEVHYVHLKNPEEKLQCVAQRRLKVLYDVEHRNGSWFIVTNVNQTVNKRFMMCEALPNCQDLWQDVSDEKEILFNGGEVRAIDTITPFVHHAVITGREGGLPRVWIVSFDDNDDDNSVKKFVQLTFDEEAHDVDLGPNHLYDTTTLILSYSSLVTPLSSLLVDMNHPVTTSKEGEGKNKFVMKQKVVPNYNPDLYTCERTTVQSRDGQTLIPVSLVYKKDIIENNTKHHPTHVTGYGSYGMSEEASFDYTRLPLLNRGVIYVIAHVRGGGEMGRQWYEEPNGAKYKCKMNTFNDFVDVARWLISSRNITTSELLSCEGRSAGGLLIGASVNQDPSLWKVAILGVPFVDVLCTMVDSTIPLTVGEWEEWGNPNEEYFFEYMKGYSPMNNVRGGGAYPSMLLTGGLHDPRVQYWEPAKFAAELRHKQDQSTSGPVCLKIDMTAGHFSASDRYKYLKELAFDYAFLLGQLGVVDSK
uniref:Prolyl endopeptidase n=1 Tax=Ditylum brightwellii TaxID=49249 RepID=A0A7S4RTJ9_9STRA